LANKKRKVVRTPGYNSHEGPPETWCLITLRRKSRFRMRSKLKYALPLTQVGLAFALLAWDWRWQRLMMRQMDMPGTSRAFKLLTSINAPLALPRALVFRHLSGWWDPLVFVISIALFWYWVAMNVLSWQNQRAAYTFSWTPLRLVVNAAVIAVGVFWLIVCWHEIHHRSELLLSWSDYAWYVALLGLPVAWALCLILFFGYDSLRLLVARNPVSSS
jgi:hypothetical protein